MEKWIFFSTTPLMLTQYNKWLQHNLSDSYSYAVKPISELHRHALSLHHLRGTNSFSTNKTASDHLCSTCITDKLTTWLIGASVIKGVN
jgi:hypothetical protein